MTEYKIKQYRRFLYILLIFAICALLTAIYLNYWEKVPSTIKIRAGIEETLNFDIPASGRIYQSWDTRQDEAVESISDQVESIPISLSSDVTLRASQIDHYIMDLKLFGVIPYKSVDIQVIQDKTLIPSGIPIGIYVRTNGILVVGIGEFENEQGEMVSPSHYILQTGDYILQVNHEIVENKKQFIQMIKESDGEEMILTLNRGEEQIELKVQPACNQNGEWKLGIWIRDNAQGIGTLTYVDTDTSFGALGHGINDVDTSMLMSLGEGVLYKTEIVGITRGKDGAPGELTGYIEYDNKNVIGEITENTMEGIFGFCKEEIVTGSNFEPIPIALKQEVETGPAQVICSVTGEPKFYDIEIEEMRLEESNVNRGLVLRVTDEELLTLTGGIIQGMLMRYNECKQEIQYLCGFRVFAFFFIDRKRELTPKPDCPYCESSVVIRY